MFSPDAMQTFELFSVSHIGVVIVFFVLFFLFLRYRRKLRHPKVDRIIGRVLFVMLVVCFTSNHLWALSVGVWNVTEDLPLHLCSLSTLLGIFLYLRRNQWLFSFYFFIGFFPPIFAIITPDLVYEFPHFKFLQYFIGHMTIPFMVVYLLISRKYLLPFKSVFYGMLTLNVLILPIFMINKWLGSNYFFLMGAPEGDTALSWFGTGFQYYFWLEIVGVVVFLISYLILKAIVRVDHRSNEKMNLPS